MLEKLKKLRALHLEAVHGVVFYPYQNDISDQIIAALLQNLRLIEHATEEDIKKLVLVELPVEISRQAGKTTAVVLTIDFIMVYFPKMFGLTAKGIRLELEIFAPQHEQAKTDFDRLKEALMRSGQLFTIEEQEDNPYKEQNNAKTIVLANGASCYISPVSKTSKPESKSPHLIVFEESQDLDDGIVKQQIWPMGAARNAPRIYIGTAGTRICYFRKLGQGKDAMKIYFEDVAKQRRKVFEETGDATHLIYEQTVRQEIEKHGLDSDEIQRPYFGKWLIGTGQFTTEEDLTALEDVGRKVTRRYMATPCFAGIDTAKHPDSTVITILRDTGKTIERKLKDGTIQIYRKKELLNWMELKGERYDWQFDLIKEFLSNYKVVALAIDSTGQGDFMPDMFQSNTQWQDEDSGLYRLKFSAQSKDIIYKNLKVSIQQSLTTLPNLSTKLGERFKQQMLDLQQEYKGQLLSVHHPKDASDVKTADLHDDFADSWALAEWAFARYNQDNNVEIKVVTPAKERQVNKDEEGRVTDYWPGLQAV